MNRYASWQAPKGSEATCCCHPRLSRPEPLDKPFEVEGEDGELFQKVKIMSSSDLSLRPFPWDELMTFAFGVLHWTPQIFWSATPRELNAALRAYHRQGAKPLDQEALAELMVLFPDEPSTQ
jgi:uncharacterized phage protein (TIGR02216 family)